MVTTSLLLKAFLLEGTENVSSPAFTGEIIDNTLVVSWCGRTPDGPMSGVARFDGKGSVKVGWLGEDVVLRQTTEADMDVNIEVVTEMDPRPEPMEYKLFYRKLLEVEGVREFVERS
jgi:hypothetical protein